MAILRAHLLLAILSLSLAAADGLPPHSLLRENIHKSTVILKGKIEGQQNPRSGVTVARFRVTQVFRGPFKSGEELTFASFKEQDRYPASFLDRDLIVFLRPRKARYAPPKWETATDLSEFPASPELENLISKLMRKKSK